MNIPSNLKYSKDHEWVRVEGDTAYIGITDFAQSELGEIVIVDITTVGETRFYRGSENGIGLVYALRRRGIGSKPEARRQPRARQFRPLRRRLDDKSKNDRPVGSRQTARRRSLQSSHSITPCRVFSETQKTTG